MSFYKQAILFSFFFIVAQNVNASRLYFNEKALVTVCLLPTLLVKRKICERRLFDLLELGWWGFHPKNRDWCVELDFEEEETCQKREDALLGKHFSKDKKTQKDLKDHLERERIKRERKLKKNYPSSKKGQRKNRYGGR